MEITNKAQWGQVGLLCFRTGVSKIVVEFSKGSHQCGQVVIFATVETNRPSFTCFPRNVGDRKQSENRLGTVLQFLENSCAKSAKTYQIFKIKNGKNILFPAH